MNALIFIMLSCASAQDFGSFKINPKLRLALSQVGNKAWRSVYHQIEVSVKSSRLSSGKAAAELAKVEYASVFHLYDERGNPYQGQISQLIVCDPRFRPRFESLRTLSGRRDVILGGANDRHVLGACTNDQVTNWAAYLNLVDEAQATVIAIRLFLPVPDVKTATLRRAGARLRDLARQLILRQTSR